MPTALRYISLSFWLLVVYVLKMAISPPNYFRKIDENTLFELLSQDEPMKSFMRIP